MPSADTVPGAAPESLSSGLVQRLALYRERRRRGSRELGRLKRSDSVLFSPGNSGRTWLRVMLTRVIELHYGLSLPPLISFDNLKKLDERIPSVAITHNRWLPFYRKPKPGREFAPYYPHRVLILIRNPLDTCVSQYFQWRYRSKDANIILKGWPPRSDGFQLKEFLEHPQTGLERLCVELDTWWRESGKFSSAGFLRYEDMLENPLAALGQAAEFLGLPTTEAILQEAVEYGSFVNMRRREAAEAVGNDEAAVISSRTPDAHKARVGKVGGYREYLSQTECDHYATLVARTLPPELGYGLLPEIGPMVS